MTPYEQDRDAMAEEYCCKEKTVSSYGDSEHDGFIEGANWSTNYWKNKGAGENEVDMITVSTNDLPRNRLVCKVEDVRKLHSQNAATIAILKAEIEQLKSKTPPSGGE
jgi:hypothetical protein